MNYESYRFNKEKRQTLFTGPRSKSSTKFIDKYRHKEYTHFRDCISPDYSNLTCNIEN